VDECGDLELDTLLHWNWKSVQLAENWRDAVAQPSARHQLSGSVQERLKQHIRLMVMP